MSFPFPHITHKETFKFTFLNEVAFKLSLEAGPEFVSFEKWYAFFKDTFGLDLSPIRYEEMIDTRIKIRNKEKGLIFEFSSSSVKLSVAQQDYSNYHSSLKPAIKLMVEKLSGFIDTCKNVEMKFVDVWPFSEDKEFSDQDIRNLENAIFSEDLQKAAQPIDANFKIAIADDGHLKTHIKYGSYYSPVNSDKTSGVALESKCELIKRQVDLKLSEVVDVASRMNDVLYDAFIWSVSPLIITMMKNQ